MTINFEAKSDRELLVMVAQQSNQTIEELKRINGTLGDHDKRIKYLETRNPFRINWRILGIISSAIALVIITVGTHVGWW